VATAAAVATSFEKSTSVLAKLAYPVSLLASLSIWLLAVRLLSG
jgi:hypothetical protein